jgi:hypothetical protein
MRVRVVRLNRLMLQRSICGVAEILALRLLGKSNAELCRAANAIDRGC